MLNGFELPDGRTARTRAKGAEKGRNQCRRRRAKAEPTKFLGYDFLETESVVETVLPSKNRKN